MRFASGRGWDLDASDANNRIAGSSWLHQGRTDRAEDFEKDAPGGSLPFILVATEGPIAQSGSHPGHTRLSLKRRPDPGTNS